MQVLDDKGMIDALARGTYVHVSYFSGICGPPVRTRSL